MSTATEPLLLTQIDGGVCRLTLNRPSRRNALSEALLDEFERTLAAIAADRSVRVVVIAASGPVFSSGHDLKEMTGRSAAEYESLFARCTRVMQGLRRLPQPVIAAVQGLATAAGCQLVAACDLAVAAETAQFATPGVKIGLFCTTPMVPLVRAVAPKRAMEMLMTGRPIGAREALEWGLVNRVVPAGELEATVEEWTRAICASSPQTVAVGKRAFYDQLALPEADAYRDAVTVMTDNALHADAQEGITAFLEKRPPQWAAQ